MFLIEGVAKRGFAAILSMPLLTELGACAGGFDYRHGAPNGAIAKRRRGIPQRRASRCETTLTRYMSQMGYLDAKGNEARRPMQLM
jgi:hypothetical protein